MNPPDHQSQRQQERTQQKPHRQRQGLLPWQWYRNRSPKARVALGSACALLLVLLVSVSVLTLRWPFAVPHRVAGVHSTVTSAAAAHVAPTGKHPHEGSEA